MEKDDKAPADKDANPSGEEGEGKGVEFSAEQQAHIDKLIGDARKKAKDQAKAEAQAAREEAEKRAREEAAEEAGEFEEIAKTRERERDQAKKDAATLKAENDQLRAAIDSMLTSEWRELSEEAREYFTGDEDDPLARLVWLPKGRKLTATLAAKADALRGNGADPRSRGDGRSQPRDEAALAANAARYG